jgi:GNAT superfamily N-acetyltransferase
MAIQLRPYTAQPFFTKDYEKVRNFLISLNQKSLLMPHFVWARWEWMITHGGLNQTVLDRIGLWEDDGMLIALATYESSLGDGYFCVDPRYAHLKQHMLDYASEFLSKDGKLRVLIDNTDREFQRIAQARGFYPTQAKEEVAVAEIDERLSYKLPKGYSVHSMADGWDFYRYDRVMWRGFNHAGDPRQTDEEIACRKQMLSSPMIRPELVLAIKGPDGGYVSHCGTWYRPGDSYAYVEPAATDPDFRNKGFGRAAVLEAVRRCGNLGAKRVLVGSSQQFYYRIGFAPAFTGTFWEKNDIFG